MPSAAKQPMMKKRGREGWICNSRRCPSYSDSNMIWYRKSRQRARERREWRKEAGNDV